jgi:outer membrane protein assembly factor BamB
MKGFDIAYDPERRVELKAAVAGKGGRPARFVEFTTPDPEGKVDLNSALGKEMGAVAYAFAILESPSGGAAELRVGTNNAVKIFLNGREVFFRNEYHHGMKMDQYPARVELKKGRNEVLLKVCQNEQKDDWAQSWSFRRGCARRWGSAVPGRDGGPGQMIRPPAALFILLGAASSLAAGDWPQFRGPQGLGISDEAALPLEWNKEKGIRWKADLPGRGLSSPVVVAGRVYVTACSGPAQERLHVLSFDASTGKELWTRQFTATGSTQCNGKTNMAAPTPAADEGRVFALFATGDLAARGRDGNLRWYRSVCGEYPTSGNSVGMAASPVLHGETLFVAMENVGESFAAAVDARTGRNLWKRPRSQKINWTTPLVVRNGDRLEVLYQSPDELTAYDPGTGSRLWSHEGGLASIPSPVAAEGLVIAPGGSSMALRPGREKAQKLWESKALGSSTASPTLYRRKVYTINSGGVVVCADAESGEESWRTRVKGPHSASPLIAGDRMYLVNEAGETTVLKLGDKPETLSVNPLEDPMLASPAASGGALFLRSDHRLYCLGAEK